MGVSVRHMDDDDDDGNSRQPVCRRDDGVCRVVVLGDPKVGKSSLIHRVVTGKFTEHYNKTSGKCRTSWSFFVAGRRIRYSMVDVPGGHFHQLSSSSSLVKHLRDADVFLVCYKISDPASLYSAVTRWCAEIHQISPQTPVVLVGCQSDHRLDSLELSKTSPVSADQALSVSQQAPNCALYVETSSKTSARSAISAFEVAALVAQGQLTSASLGVPAPPIPPPTGPPPAPQQPPPVPPKPPRRAMSQMTLDKENLFQSATMSPAGQSWRGSNQNNTNKSMNQINVASSVARNSPKLSLKTSRERSSTSLLSLNSHARTPKMARRSGKNHPKEEKLVKIKCQRLNEAKEYEEVEVEVPQNIYETLRFYNDPHHSSASSLSRDKVGKVSAEVQHQELIKSKKSLASKIRSMFAKT